MAVDRAGSHNVGHLRAFKKGEYRVSPPSVQTETDGRLEYLFDNVNRWLQFAEAKNGVTLTASGAALFGVFHVIYSLKVPPLHPALTVMAFGLIAVILSSLLSFWSKLFIGQTFAEKFYDKLIGQRVLTGARSRVPIEMRSLMFYGHIRLFECSEYQQTLARFLGQKSPLTAWQKTLAEQIWVNSRIAYRKYTLFNVSIDLVFLAILASVLVFICTRHT